MPKILEMKVETQQANNGWQRSFFSTKLPALKVSWGNLWKMFLSLLGRRKYPFETADQEVTISFYHNGDGKLGAQASLINTP